MAGRGLRWLLQMSPRRQMSAAEGFSAALREAPKRTGVGGWHEGEGGAPGLLST